ncbi:two-component system sensor histidine kinase PmrB [Affinibrenneria salicis]|uniref:histidine kinase n=1 Tax=Affinibrenneria salicis TaxID=2590031 RepID=A0A5J5G2F7_9GAMM|nr:two-component system sensor histidine kinase PmrB [Affinibrenneria salicis]KAA9000759.1 two-component system sensor histidine kinase PmrB [Affinibrenneria salicis]
MGSMRNRLIILLSVILFCCQLLSVLWLWHESREQIDLLVDETLSEKSRTLHVNNEVDEAIASLLLPSIIMLGVTITLSFITISAIIRPLSVLQKKIARRSSDNLSEITLDASSSEVHDITVSVNNLLLRLNESLNQERLFTADVAHELRTPLAGIRLHLEILKEQGIDGIDALIVRIEQLTLTIEQLLMLSRASQSLLQGKQYSIDLLRDIVEPLADEMNELVSLRQQKIKFPAATFSINGNAILLRLLLRNLIENASRYSPERTTIVVSLIHDRLENQLIVSDQGPGIDDAMAEVVMRPFRRIDRRHHGFGLGLSIVSRVIQLHHGRLSLLNRTDGPGLNVICRFAAAP